MHVAKIKIAYQLLICALILALDMEKKNSLQPRVAAHFKNKAQKQHTIYENCRMSSMIFLHVI